VVMEGGKVAESGSPRELLLRAGGLFASFVDELGVDKRARYIRVIDTCEKRNLH
jgi:hypothetical protein